MHLHQESFTIYSFLVLLGGLSIFLHGLELMSHNLKKASGNTLKIILEKVTEHRIYGVAVGTMITAVIQSSSATTAILVSLVQSGLMTFERTVGIIMGANIGTTVTAQIFAFKITAWSLPIIFLGFMVCTIAKRTKTKNVGMSVMGLGMIFLGLAAMSDAMKPLRESEMFMDVVQNMEHVWIGVLVGAIFTALVQSSSASIGIMIGMSIQGLISIEAAVPVVFGANLGTCVTAILASLKASYEAKRVAAAHILFNIGGVLIFIFWIPKFIEIIMSFSPADDIARQIANAQTAFNVVATLIWLPFIRQLQWAAEKIVPEKAVKRKKHVLPHIRNFLTAPELALIQSKQTIKYIKNLVKDILISSRSYLIEQSKLHEDKISEIREEQKTLRRDILEFLGHLNRQRLSTAQTTDILNQITVVNEIDYVANRLEIAFDRMANKVPKFTQSSDDLEEYFKKTVKYFSKSCNAFLNNSLTESVRVSEKITELKPFEKKFKSKYLEKMYEGVSESHKVDQVNLEVLEILRSVNSTSRRICQVLVDEHERAEEPSLIK